MKNFKIFLYLLLMFNIGYNVAIIEKSEEIINFPDIITLETESLILRKISIED